MDCQVCINVRCADLSWLEGGGSYSGWGVGVPTLARGEGYLPCLGGRGSYPGWGVPTLGRARGYLSWPGGGGGTYPGQGKGHPPGVERQTPMKTVPSPILRMWTVKIHRTNQVVLACNDTQLPLGASSTPTNPCTHVQVRGSKRLEK